jgi:putative DNA primase/helicase
MTDLRALSRALGGKQTPSGFVCSCPLPNHGKGRGDKNPSLTIGEGKNAELVVHCKAGCNSLDILHALRDRGLLDERPPERSAKTPPRPTTYFPNDPVEPDRRALELWRSAIPIEGTLGETYLRARGIGLAIPPTLRFLPSFEYMPRVFFPAMIAAVQAADRRVIAAQLTFLHPSGTCKAPCATQRKTFGPLGAGAIRLGPAGAVVGLAEGSESALSAMELFGVTVWATLGAQRLGSIRLPSEVDKVVLYPDRDEAGRGAAQKALEVYRAMRFVECKFPAEGCGDFNDELTLESALS